MTRLSVKALRIYDERGLLPPAEVDASSGYRYYRLSQANRAEAIRRLRALGMSLDAIGRVLASDDRDAVAAALEEQRLAIETEILDGQRRLAAIERLVRDEDPLVPYEVSVKTVPEQPVIALRTPTEMASVAETIGASFGRLGQALATSGSQPAGPPFIVFHDVIDDETPGDIELCMPVVELPTAGAVSDPGLEAHTLEGGLMATTVHRGAYFDVAPAYHVLTGWILGHGHEQAGPPREIYLNDPTTVAPGEELTEVQWPIA